jgi:lipoprotein-anchoring transpeptidase ErfK/SrfK
MTKRKNEASALLTQYAALALLARFQKEPIIVRPIHVFDLPRHSWRRRMAIGGLAVLIGVVGIWTAGAAYGVQYEVRGRRIPARTPDTILGMMMREQVSDYRLRLVQPDGTHHDYSLQDLGMYVETNTSVAIAHQKRWALGTLKAWWRPVPVELVIGANAEALKTFIATQATIPIRPGQNARLTVQKGTSKVIKEVPGEQFGLSQPMHTILQAASHLRTEPLRMKIVPLDPPITAERLESAKSQLDSILKQTIVFQAGTRQIKPDRKEVGSWIAIKPDPANRTVKLRVNASKMQAYVDWVARTYGSPPRTQVVLGSGSVIAGSPGVVIRSSRVVNAKLTQEVLAGRGVQVKLPTVLTTFPSIRAPTYSKWIEVDLTTKRLYTYEKAARIRSFLISAGAPGTPTPTGTYAIYAKYSSQTMSGPNADGSRYVQPNVPWVNYFYSDFAIHGNYWRPAWYFGSVHSSHGCVGLRTGDAAVVYGWAPIGTPVVIHY